MRAMTMANHIINKCYNDGKPVNNIRLNLILWLMSKDYLKERPYPLFCDDEVLLDGAFPKFKDVYYRFCSYGERPIGKVPEECVAYSNFLETMIWFYNQKHTQELLRLATN